MTYELDDAPAAPSTGRRGFVGYPVSNTNASQLEAQLLPFWYKIIDHGRHTFRHSQCKPIPDKRRVHKCTSPRTRLKLCWLAHAGEITVMVSPTRPTQSKRKRKRTKART